MIWGNSKMGWRIMTWWKHAQVEVHSIDEKSWCPTKKAKNRKTPIPEIKQKKTYCNILLDCFVSQISGVHVYMKLTTIYSIIIDIQYHPVYISYFTHPEIWFHWGQDSSTEPSIPPETPPLDPKLQLHQADHVPRRDSRRVKVPWENRWCRW